MDYKKNNASPIISLTKAPMRISLAGGGTDLASYASQFEGSVLGLAIDRYVSVAMYPRSFDDKVYASWEYLESAPSANELNNTFGRAALNRLGISNNVQIATFADAPSGTGLGGSGAFLVALLHSGDRNIRNIADKFQLAEEASAIEMNDLNLSVGKQDHYMASLGGLQLLKFKRDLSVEVITLQPGPKCRNYFSERLLLFFTGQRRVAGEVLSAQSKRLESGDQKTLESLHAIHSLVEPMQAAIRDDNPDLIGPLLDRHWKEKSRLSSKVKVGNIDHLYELALSNGADGGKILGAGGGGFLLLSAREGQEHRLRNAMLQTGIQELKFGCDEHGTTKAVLPV